MKRPNADPFVSIGLGVALSFSMTGCAAPTPVTECIVTTPGDVGASSLMGGTGLFPAVLKEIYGIDYLTYQKYFNGDDTARAAIQQVLKGRELNSADITPFCFKLDDSKRPKAGGTLLPYVDPNSPYQITLVDQTKNKPGWYANAPKKQTTKIYRIVKVITDATTSYSLDPLK